MTAIGATCDTQLRLSLVIDVDDFTDFRSAACIRFLEGVVTVVLVDRAAVVPDFEMAAVELRWMLLSGSFTGLGDMVDSASDVSSLADEWLALDEEEASRPPRCVAG